LHNAKAIPYSKVKYRGSEKSDHLENRIGVQRLSEYGRDLRKELQIMGTNNRQASGENRFGKTGWRRERNWVRTFSA
jgi:hypothetical protein